MRSLHVPACTAPSFRMTTPVSSNRSPPRTPEEKQPNRKSFTIVSLTSQELKVEIRRHTALVRIPVVEQEGEYGSTRRPEIPRDFDRVCVYLPRRGSKAYKVFWKSSINIHRTLRSGTITWTGDVIVVKLDSATHDSCTMGWRDQRKLRDAAMRYTRTGLRATITC